MTKKFSAGSPLICVDDGHPILTGLYHEKNFTHFRNFYPWLAETINLNKNCPTGFKASKNGCKDIDECETMTHDKRFENLKL